MAMQDRKTQYSWKSTSLSLLLSRLLISFWNAASSVFFCRKKRLQVETRSRGRAGRVWEWPELGLDQVCTSRWEPKKA